LRETVLPLRTSISDYVAASRDLSAARRLLLVKSLRDKVFELQAVHAELMAEFESLLEYEALYLNEASMSVPRLPVLVGQMELDYLRPLKLLRSRVDSLFRGTSTYVDSAVTAVYADANLLLGQKMQLLTYVQAVVAVILFILAIVQAVSVFLK
jgi:hypothetical protein